MHCEPQAGIVLKHQWLPCTGDRSANPHAGQVPILVFLHGIAGSAAAWGSDFRHLTDSADVLLFDCLGFGDSPKPDAPYTSRAHVDALHASLLALSDQLPSRRLVLVGHSMGALLAAHWGLMLANGTQAFGVEGIVLLSLPVYDSEGEAINRVGQTSLFNRWMALETPLAKATCWLMCRVRPWLMPLMPRLLPDLPADVARDSLKHSWRSYSESLREVVLRSRGGQLLHALQQCNSRLLMLHGLSDILAPADNLRAALADLQPGTGQTTVYWLEGGHDIVFTHAAQLAGYIRQFVISTQTR